MYESKTTQAAEDCKILLQVLLHSTFLVSRDLMKLSGPGASRASPLCHSNAVSLAEWAPEDSHGGLQL